MAASSAVWTAVGMVLPKAGSSDSRLARARAAALAASMAGPTDQSRAGSWVAHSVAEKGWSWGSKTAARLAERTAACSDRLMVPESVVRSVACLVVCSAGSSAVYWAVLTVPGRAACLAAKTADTSAVTRESFEAGLWAEQTAALLAGCSAACSAACSAVCLAACVVAGLAACLAVCLAACWADCSDACSAVRLAVC